MSKRVGDQVKWRRGSNASGSPRSRVSRSGFTLIELLVALTLLGILGGSIAGVLHNSTDSIDQGTAAVDNMTRLRSLETVLGTALRDALPLEVSDAERRMMANDGSYDPADGRYRFCGEEQRLSFCLRRPFLSIERDGYTHWVTLEIRLDEDTEQTSLWLRDVSFLQGIDNPVGEDWGDAMMSEDQILPTQEVCLIQEADDLIFRYWELVQDGNVDEPEPEEIEPDELDGDYAVVLPDYIELEMSMPKTGTESLYMDFCLKSQDF